MKRVLLGMLMFFGLIGASEAQYYAPWYAKNPSFTNVVMGGWLRIGSTLDVAGTATFASSVTVAGSSGSNGDLRVSNQVFTKNLIVSGTSFYALDIYTDNRKIWFDATDTWIDGSSTDRVQITVGAKTAFDAVEATSDILYLGGDKSGDSEWDKTQILSTLQVGTDVTISTWTATGLALNGDIQISSRPCAEFFFDLNASSLTVINTANVYEIVCGTGALLQTAADGTPVSAWFKTANDVNGNPNRITYVGPNTHKFAISAVISFDASAATVMYIQLYKNGTAIPRSRQHISVSNAASESEPVTQIVQTLATNDYIELWATTNDADDLSIHLGNITMYPID